MYQYVAAWNERRLRKTACISMGNERSFRGVINIATLGDRGAQQPWPDFASKKRSRVSTIFAISS